MRSKGLTASHGGLKHQQWWHESEFIEDIVQAILHKLSYAFPRDTKGLVGIDAQVEELMLLLAIGSNDARIIGVWGMGGIVEMARQKANLRTHSKSVTVEGASTQHVNQETNQKMREASTQDVRPPVYATRGPSKYLDVWDLPDDKVIELPLNSMYQPVDEGARAFTGFLKTIARKPHMCPIRYLTWKDIPEELKEECWHLVERKYVVPTNPTAYAALKTFTLQKIRKAWRVHKCRLKTSHYIPHLRNKARVKNNRPKGCIPEDWDVLVDHWYTDDVVIESEKNRDRRSKQEDLHTVGSCSFAVHAAKKAKANGRPVECAALYSILHTRKDGSTVNHVVQAKMDKRKELLAEPSNQLQSSDISGSITWAPDDVFAKVMGKECKGCIRRVGFGPSPSGRSSKSALTDLQIRSSQERDNEVAQLKASLANMQEKLSSFEEMKERLSQFEEMEKRMAHMLQQMQQITSQCSQDVSPILQSLALQKSSAASYQPSSL